MTETMLKHVRSEVKPASPGGSPSPVVNAMGLSSSIPRHGGLVRTGKRLTEKAAGNFTIHYAMYTPAVILAIEA